MPKTELEQILGPDTPPFALLHRPETTGQDRVELLVGEMSDVDTLAELPGQDVLALIPYRQIGERGFRHTDDGTPLSAMRITMRTEMPVARLMDAVPDTPVSIADADFETDDDEYAELVRRVLADEIGTGEGANFVIRRSFRAHVEDYSVALALTVFRRLLRDELGAHWTFLVHTGDRTLIGASPERHITVHDGLATMNPISGTYRYPSERSSVQDVLGFLHDRKESDELYMVLDEELKMMGQICERGGRVVGPHLKQMAKLAHTEYFITGHTSLDVREVLRRTMFAPTVTGSPLENACRVIAKYEPDGRGYYAGALALIDRDERGRQQLDSTILIRTADIDATGSLRLDVGATLVRHSNPIAEVAETRVKAAALLSALGVDGAAPAARPKTAPDLESRRQWESHPQVREALAARNTGLASFWLGERDAVTDGPLAGRKALVVDCEDTFTAMLAHELRSLGLDIDLREYHEPVDVHDGYDLIVVGPGPGDPNSDDHPKIAAMRRITREVLDARIPLLSVCLGHQVLARELGFDVRRLPAPNQGVQRIVPVFGHQRKVGFYNTFAAYSDFYEVALAGTRDLIEVSRESGTGEVFALRGPGFRSLQFHPESVLTEHGVDILEQLLTSLLPAAALPL